MNNNWPFSDEPNLAVISIRSIIEGNRPILRVTHDQEDGSWQFLDGNPLDIRNAVVVSFSSIYTLDASIGELANLPLGWYAWRASTNSDWIRGKKEQLTL